MRPSHPFLNKSLLCFTLATSLLIPAVSCAKAILNIVPSLSTQYVRSAGVSTVSYTVTNNTRGLVSELVIDPYYDVGPNAAILSITNNLCHSVVLAPNESCTFNVLVKNVNRSFHLRPRVCIHHGGVCSVPSKGGTKIVLNTIIRPLTAYFGMASNDSPNPNTILALNIATGKQTFIPGFRFNATSAISISNDGSKLYVINVGPIVPDQSDPTANQLVVLDLNTNAISYINGFNTVGFFPQGNAVTPDGSKVFVSTYYPENPSFPYNYSVYAVNASTNTIIQPPTIIPGSPPSYNVNPYGMAAHPGGAYVYVSNAASNVVSVLDAQTNAWVKDIVVDPINAVSNPQNIAVNSAGTFAYVSNNNSASNSVAVINALTNTFVTTISVPTSPRGLAVTPDGSTLYVADHNGAAGNIYVIDTATSALITTITTTPIVDLGGVSITPDGTKVYVTSGVSSSIVVVDVATNTFSTVGVTGRQVTYGNFIS